MEGTFLCASAGGFLEAPDLPNTEAEDKTYH